MVPPHTPWPHESDDSFGSIDYHDKENDEDEYEHSNTSTLKRKRDWIYDDSSSDEEYGEWKRFA